MIENLVPCHSAYFQLSIQCIMKGFFVIVLYKNLLNFSIADPSHCHFPCYVMRNGFPKMKHELLSILTYFCSCLPLLLLLPCGSYFNATHCLFDLSLEQTFLECIDISKGLMSCYKLKKKKMLQKVDPSNVYCT